MLSNDPHVMGMRVGLGAALAVVDRWDIKTRRRIGTLLREIDAASAIEACQRTDPEEGLDPKGESAVAKPDAQPEPSS